MASVLVLLLRSLFAQLQTTGRATIFLTLVLLLNLDYTALDWDAAVPFLRSASMLDTLPFLLSASMLDITLLLGILILWCPLNGGGGGGHWWWVHMALFGYGLTLYDATPSSSLGARLSPLWKATWHVFAGETMGAEYSTHVVALPG